MAQRGLGGKSLKFSERELIIDENLSPSLVTKLQEAGYNVKMLNKGTLDPEIIKYAKDNNAIVVTNNIKDFKNQGITTMEVKASLATRESVDTVVNKINNVNGIEKEYPNYFSPEANIPLTDY